MTDLNPLFCPKSIALVGASPDPEKLGGIALQNLKGLKGEVYPVNPGYAEIMGLKAYPSAAELPEKVDLSIIMRPAAEVPGILESHRGMARFVLIISSGFAEIGEIERQKEIVRIAGEAGIRLVGPNCIGLFNPRHRLDSMFVPNSRLRRPRRGNLAVVSQSGAVLMSLLDGVGNANVGVSRAVNYGNAADLDAPDFFDYLSDDEDTAVVVSYLESVGDGTRFLDAARRLAERKPLLILKAGKGAGGGAAAFSHTGRLAGNYRVFRSLLEHYGLREVEGFEELLDAAKALSYQRPAPGRRVCIITNGGGAGVLAADECGRQGLALPALPEPVADALRDNFPSFYTVANPMDLTGQVRVDNYAVALSAVGEHYDGFLVIALAGVPGVAPEVAEHLVRFRRSVAKPVTAYIAQGWVAPRLIRPLEKAGIPVFRSPERAVRGLSALLGKGESSGQA